MSSSQFAVNHKRFYLPQEDPINLFRKLDKKAEGQEEFLETPALSRKGKTRFFYIDYVDRWLEGYREQGQWWHNFFDTLTKVVTVFITLLAFFMCVAIYYLPAWAPWGICLPSFILLSWVQGGLKHKVEECVRDNQYVPFLKEFIKTNSLEALHPIGEWDLLEIDSRLKSDLMMQSESKKKHPPSGKAIESVVQDCDLELTPYVQEIVASRFASITKIEKGWDGVKRANTEATACCSSSPITREKIHTYKNFFPLATRGNNNSSDENNLAMFWKKRDEASTHAYGVGLNSYDFPPTTIKDRAEITIATYRPFCRLYPQVERILKEGEELYTRYAFLDPTQLTYAGWREYTEFADSVKEGVVHLIKCLEKQNPEKEDYE